MYEAFFGLSARPFAEHADPDFFVESDARAARLRALVDGIAAQHPIFVVTGETGCGKTMLALKVMQDLDPATTVGFITNPHPGVSDLTPWAVVGFGLELTGLSDPELEEALALFLIAEYAEGRRCLLVVDEAQHLTPAALAGLHRCLDLNREGDCLLQVILVAQPGLLQTMRDPSLAQWAERTSLVCFAGPLPQHEIAGYVHARLAVAGAGREIFTDRALAAIAAASGGVPRLINAICDTALTYALSQGRSSVDRDLIADVVDEGHSVGLGSLAMLTPIEDEPKIEPPMTVETVEAVAVPLLPEPATAMEVESELPTTSEIALPAPVENPEPAPIIPVAEEHAVPEETVDPQVLVAWPSISGRHEFARPETSGDMKPGVGIPGASLRRRFLPRG